MDGLETRLYRASKTVERLAEQQRKEASQRIKRKYWAECAANQNHYCEAPCDFWVIENRIDAENRIVTKGGSCVYDLAPVTSQRLPCPYFRTLRQR